jgi:hypothetical protein
MRSIQVSADLYAAIWKQQKPGEASEEEILRRLLGVPDRQSPAVTKPSTSAIGFYDRRNGVTFPAGFEIFRTYFGQEYRAHAIGGLWCRKDNGEAYPSLNQLSESLGTSENAWDMWFYANETGERKPISTLRDPSRIRRRMRRSEHAA